MVLYCSGTGYSVYKHKHKKHTNHCKTKLTKSPFGFGTKTFISEDFELTISTFKDSELKYIWQPSVLSIEIVATLPST